MKLCINCKNYYESEDKCKLIYGNMVNGTGRYVDPGTAREVESMCGAEARHFQPKEQKAATDLGSQREILTALTEGRTVVDEIGVEYKFVNGTIHERPPNDSAWSTSERSFAFNNGIRVKP